MSPFQTRFLPTLISLMESVSTRLLITAGKLIASGIPPRLACVSAIAGPLSDEEEATEAITRLIEISI